MGPTTPVLDIQDLSTHIKLTSSVVQAVGNVDMTIDAGETLGVVGESGCGKSMTGLSIMGLLPPGGSIVGGSVKLDGRELVGLKQEDLRQVRGNDIAMIFQDPLTSLDPTKTVGYQVAEPVRLHKGTSRAEALHRAVEVLSLVGLPRPKERLDDYPHQLSGGLRQRVMIAMALANEPKLLIADEPTTALDVTIQAQILSLLRDLKDRLGMAMLLITHDMGVIAGHADRVNVMYAGRVVETADVRELFNHMHHPYTQALLASIPQLDQDANKALHAIPGLPPDLSHPPQGCRFAARCSRATDKCRTEEPPLSGKTYEHRSSCWHPVDGPLVLAVIGEAGPDAASTGLVSSDAESVAEAAPSPRQGRVHARIRGRRRAGRRHGSRTAAVRGASGGSGGHPAQLPRPRRPPPPRGRRGGGRPGGDGRRTPRGGRAHGRGDRGERGWGRPRCSRSPTW